MPNFRQFIPGQEMPRGTGFVPGQVYNSPPPSGWRSPMEQGMQRSFPQMSVIDPRTGTVARPMQGQQPGPPMQGQQAGAPTLTPEMMQQIIRQKQAQDLEQRYMQERIRREIGGGLLSDPGSVARPQEMGGLDPRSVVREQEYSDPRADPGLEGLRFIQEQTGGGMY